MNRASIAAALCLAGVLLTCAAVALARSGEVRATILETSVPTYADAPRAATPSPAPKGGNRFDPDPDWVQNIARRAGIPEVAVRAYAPAVLRLAADDPDCGLGWTTLAGIGYVESAHGTTGERALLDDGHSDRRILGPALNGLGEVAAIPAGPESMAWQGDPDWDHAVGPMQFIPATWKMWASDGDSDGIMDPNDLDDAALAAGRYLCAGGLDLTSGAGWRSAVLSYNHAQEYVDAVHAAATAYATRIG